LFQREQLVLDNALKHIKKLKSSSPDREMFAGIVSEYANLLKQLRKVVKISDLASEVLINEKKTNQEKISELENELLQNQISIMLSQIRPHFLYNALVAIQELCHIDPETASEAVGEFSNYLRGNLDSLSIKNTIPFEKELRHVETYLSLERKRFGEKLSVAYDVRARDFYLPALTLQPIVENAVRHGVTKREEGGSVKISTDEGETDSVITVTDDGVGFDTGSSHVVKRGEKILHERLHVGIENVRSRLYSMCGGTLSVESSPGAGTTAVITIPKIIQKEASA
ncbi:MAG: histidine kinase, partial [Synergistaceae bacterium]|nr:histidine kinase [Synergistaceae bacterium]